MTKSNLCKFAVVFAAALFVSLGVEGARVNKFNLGSSSPSSYTHTVRYGTAEIIPAVVINEYEVAPPPAGKVARITIATTSSNLSPTTSSGCFKVQVGSPLAEWHYISGSYTIESSSSKWLRLEAYATPGTYAALYTSYYHLSYSYQVTYTISVTYANPTPPPADLVV